jgi:hypothetical protein
MINPNYTVDYFNVGDIVFYVPPRAIRDYGNWIGGGDYSDGDFFDPKMSNMNFNEGIVSSKNDTYVFVKYWNKGELSPASQATNPKDLVLWKKSKI